MALTDTGCLPWHRKIYVTDPGNLAQSPDQAYGKNLSNQRYPYFSHVFEVGYARSAPSPQVRRPQYTSKACVISMGFSSECLCKQRILSLSALPR